MRGGVEVKSNFIYPVGRLIKLLEINKVVLKYVDPFNIYDFPTKTGKRD